MAEGRDQDLDMVESQDNAESQDISLETPPEDVFMAPSIDRTRILSGESYTYHSSIPETIADDMAIECVLGVDEAGRGPVLGPMVYALYYLPLEMHRSLLADTHQFDDSKALTPTVRSLLMQKVCTPSTDLYTHSGWATRVMSARDISGGQLHPSAPYNLNAQAMDATIDLIRQVLDSRVNVKEIYIDTIGPPATYQKKLERIFPAVSITVAKKADSLYPCVSAASVCAKVTRDAALDVLYTSYSDRQMTGGATVNGERGAKEEREQVAWGSGYPSDARCTTWLKKEMHPVFGWGNECRFSWGTAKELLEAKSAPCPADWAEAGAAADDVEDSMKLTGYWMGVDKGRHGEDGKDDGIEKELGSWFGTRVTEAVF